MKVAKFGGSSLSDGSQIKKVAHIIQKNPEIGVVVVSAPGKRHEDDTKVTDLLIALHTNYMADIDTQPVIKQIIGRYQDIIDELGLKSSLAEKIQKQLESHMNTFEDSDRLLDALKSCGEDFNAMLIADYLNSIGSKSKYMSPKEVGIIVSDEPGNARLLDESYQEIAKIKGYDGVIIVPGFFGYTKDGQIVTFSRGGSDISGAIVARGVDADLYENYTDQSFVYSAHPGIVKKANGIKEISYREMRELAYSGFGIFHAEALAPLYEVKIPVMVRNTNQPEITGTKIVYERHDTDEYPVIGVSGEPDFMIVTIKDYLLNREVGFVRRVLSIFEDFNINIDHVPTGIDDISVIFRADQIESQQKLDDLLAEIERQFQPEWIHVDKDIAMIAVVGEGMAEYIGIANAATQAFKEANISLNMISQGASEASMFFSIDQRHMETAIRSLYKTYFSEDKNI